MDDLTTIAVNDMAHEFCGVDEHCSKDSCPYINA